MISIGNGINVGAGQKLLVIAGPCQIESAEHALFVAKAVAEIAKTRAVNLVFKSSFDKANRTSLGSHRGVGVEKGLEILAQIRSDTGLPVLTDVHNEEQASLAGKVVDILQIPAFLCRQTDLLIAAGETGKPVNIKKGQFLAPEDMRFAAEKIASTGNTNIMLCERGSCFGYRDLVVDMRALVTMRELGYPVVFDATHSVQVPGTAAGTGGKSGGRREFILPLARAASAVGIDGLFVECHEEPSRAPSDSESMLPLLELPALLDQVLAIKSLSQ